MRDQSKISILHDLLLIIIPIFVINLLLHLPSLRNIYTLLICIKTDSAN